MTDAQTNMTPPEDQTVRSDPKVPPAEEAVASEQVRGEQSLIPIVPNNLKTGIRPATADDVAEAVAGAVRAGPMGAVVRTILSHSAEQFGRAEERNDALREKLTSSKVDLAVANNELKHAGIRAAAQQLLQVLGGALIGYGLGELKTGPLGWAPVSIGAAMVLVGCLPTISLLWRRGNQ